MDVINARGFLSLLFAFLFFIPRYALSDEIYTVDEAIKLASGKLITSLNAMKQSGPVKVGIAKFRDGNAGVVCNPLSIHLTDGLRQAMLDTQEGRDGRFELISNLDPKIVDVVIIGQWQRSLREEISLTIKAGDVRNETIRNLSVVKTTFVEQSLPKEARKCILEYEAVGKKLNVGRSLLIRSAPRPTAEVVKELEPGSQLWISARVKNTDWKVVRLPDDDSLPYGARERGGFFFGDIGGQKKVIVLYDSRSRNSMDYESEAVQRVMGLVRDELAAKYFRVDETLAGSPLSGTGQTVSFAREKGANIVVIFSLNVGEKRKSGDGYYFTRLSLSMKALETASSEMFASEQRRGTSKSRSTTAIPHRMAKVAGKLAKIAVGSLVGKMNKRFSGAM